MCSVFSLAPGAVVLFVEAASCPATGVTLSGGEHVPPNKVKAHHIGYRLRLGANVLEYLPQAERCWEFQR